MARTKPYLNAVKHAHGWDIFWKGKQVAQSSDWLAAPRVSEAFIVGSGPSIATQALERLNDKPVILLNGAISLLQTGVVKDALAVVVEDARHMYINAHNFALLPKHIPFVLSLDAVHGFLYVAGVNALQGRPLYILNNLEKPYGEPRQTLADCCEQPYAHQGKHVGFSTDLNQGFFICGTVMYAGLQTAVQLGAKALFLVGFDMSNLPRFYDAASGGAWTGLEAGLARVVNGVTLAQTVVKGRGGEIFNCSPSSNIPREILSYSELLESKEQHANQ